MEDFKQLIQGVYDMMNNVSVPVLGYDVSLWAIFLFGALGTLVVWFLKRFFE